MQQNVPHVEDSLTALIDELDQAMTSIQATVHVIWPNSVDSMTDWPDMATEAVRHADAGRWDACRKCLLSQAAGVLEVARWEYMTHVAPRAGASAPLFADVRAEIAHAPNASVTGDTGQDLKDVLQECITQIDRMTGRLQSSYLAGDHVAQYHQLIAIAAVLITAVQRREHCTATAQQ